jgi:replication-associated recombination protein RarA
MEQQSLLEKYRPRRLRDVCGQAAVIRSLSRFVRCPSGKAFLFHGPSGVGKTCTARAMAAGLGIVPELAEIGGLYEIASGELNAENVREAMRRLQYRPMMGSGWRMLLCNEADRMTSSAETIWLDALERLPLQSVVVFTTNAPEHLTRRLRDRCEEVAFEWRSEVLRRAVRRFVRKVWKQEISPDVPRWALDSIGWPSPIGSDSTHPSFRLALQQLESWVREFQVNVRQRA